MQGSPRPFLPSDGDFSRDLNCFEHHLRLEGTPFFFMEERLRSHVIGASSTARRPTLFRRFAAHLFFFNLTILLLADHFHVTFAVLKSHLATFLMGGTKSFPLLLPSHGILYPTNLRKHDPSLRIPDPFLYGRCPSISFPLRRTLLPGTVSSTSNQSDSFFLCFSMPFRCSLPTL